MVHTNLLRILYWDIVQEIQNITCDQYYDGSGTELDNSNSIFQRCKDYSLVTQQWLDERSNFTTIELYCEIILALGCYTSSSAIEPEPGMFINTKKQ